MAESAHVPLRWESTGDQWWYASPIDFAAANGHYDLVRELLRIDSNLIIKLTSLRRLRRLESVWDDDSRFASAPLLRAQIARKLFQDCESLLTSGYSGWLLYTAAAAGDAEFSGDLLRRDPLLVFGEGEYGVSDILYAAARSRNSELFRVLLNYAAAPHAPGEASAAFSAEIQNRAAHAAARGGDLRVLRELLSSCSSTSGDVLSLRDGNGATLLHSAAAKNQIQVVEWLLESFSSMIDATDNRGNAAVHVAAFRGQLLTLQAIVAVTGMAARNNAGETVLHVAVTGFGTGGFRRLDKQLEVIRWLVTAGEIMEIVNAVDMEGRTALHVAVAGDFPAEVAELLITVSGIDLDVEDGEGMTALDLLRRRPRSRATEKVISKVVTAGGTSKSTAAGLKPLGKIRIPASPGMEFGVPDNEIFLLYCGGSQRTSSCSGSETRKEGAIAAAARRVKSLIGRKGSSPGERTPTPLRRRLAEVAALQGNKRVIAWNQASSPASYASSCSSSSSVSSSGSACYKSPSGQKKKGFLRGRRYLCLGADREIEGERPL